MKVVILGAGASYDCIYDRFRTIENTQYPNGNRLGPNPDMKPPLGSELFDARDEFRRILSHHSGALAISDNASIASDIEVFLDKMKENAERSKDNHLAWQLISTQLYLRELLLKVSEDYFDVGKSNYSVLLSSAYEYSRVKNVDVVFITFNYDILLEKSLAKVTPQKIAVVDDYINSGVKIIKPHGSCNWVKKFKNIITNTSDTSTIDTILQREAFNFISNDPKFEFHDAIEVSQINSLNMHNPFKNGTEHSFPQLAIPLKSKSDFVCPQPHIDEMERVLNRASEILIIGWKCGEIKFRELLERALAERTIKITIVDRNWQNIESQFKKISPTSQIKSFKMDWVENGSDETSLDYAPTHRKSSFSSYTRNVSAGRFENFFST
jgi:hypothetical protein